MPPEVVAPTRASLKLSYFLIPVAILIAGGIIALSLYTVRLQARVLNGSGNPEAVRPVTPADHIIGSPAAPITIIEYSDIDSPYGKQLERTMEQLMTEYANGGKVAWVYRHFPLTNLHPDAAMHALAAECAASISTPLTFFTFIDTIASMAPDATLFDPKQYGKVVSKLGLNQGNFTACMTNKTYEEKVHQDYSNALASGAISSPYIVLVVQGQKPRSIQGAPPYKALKEIIDGEIAKLPK